MFFLLRLQVVLGQSFFNDLSHFAGIELWKDRLVYTQVGTVGRLGDLLNIRLWVWVFLQEQSSQCYSISLNTRKHSLSTRTTNLSIHRVNTVTYAIISCMTQKRLGQFISY